MIQILKVHPENPDLQLIRPVAEALRQGKLVAFPTETVYGLGANALDPVAVARIFDAKGRPADDPLIVHLAETSWLPRAVKEISPIALRLAEAFWPGPLTLILPKRPEIPDLVTAGKGTVAVRVPAHPVALMLIREADTLVAAPSANLFGHTSPTRASHVLVDLGKRIHFLLDGGETHIGVESTVLDLTCPVPTILRPGGATREQISEVLGEEVALRGAGATEGPQVSPGLLSQHYSPQAELIYLLNPECEGALENLVQIAKKAVGDGRCVGMLLIEEDVAAFRDLPVQIASLGAGDDLWQAAHHLYAGMRSLDEQHVDLILARDLGDQGPGLALRDRLRRAARQVIAH